MQADWELSQSFTSDGQGVRAACVLQPLKDSPDAYRIVAGTQGGSLWEFSVPSGSMQSIEYQHNHAVTSILASPHQTLYVTGCKDSVVRVFDASHHTLLCECKGHDKAVTSLAWASFNPKEDDDDTLYLWTGSWDGTAKLWKISGRKTATLVTTLSGHENTVSVCALPSVEKETFQVATGSAGVAQNNVISNHSVRLWQISLQTGESQLLHKVSNDHEGPIRDVILSHDMLVTCSNDGTVKLRSVTSGETQSTLCSSGEAPMLLSLCSLREMVVAAGSEDGHVFLWNISGGEAQVIRHASCVWSVVALPEGDLGTCSQDGVLRIFTQATDRMAPQSERELFEKQVQDALSKTSKGPSPEEVAKLPLWETNQLQQGKSEGQVQLFQKNGIAIAAQWSAASQTWIEVGQVMGNANDDGSGGGMIDGVAYDHVLPLEVDTTGGEVAKMQIGYNDGENPFVAAQRFIDAHMLPQYHLSEIADYISKRVGHAAPTLGMDTSTTTSAVPTTFAFQHLPNKTYKAFELTKVASLEKMQSKLVEMGSLNDTQRQVLESLLSTLGATNRYHASQISDAELGLISHMLSSWKPADAFPALDLARLVVLHPDAASRDRTSYWKKVLPLVLQQCSQVTESDGTATVAIPMLSLRLFANCFRGGPGSLEAVAAHLDPVLQCAERHVSSSNKNIRLSVATLLFNVSFYLHSNASTAPSVGNQVVAVIDKVLASNLYESEPIYRVLVALGTVCLANKDAKEAAKSLYLTTKVEPAASSHGDKAKAAAKEIYTVLSS